MRCFTIALGLALIASPAAARCRNNHCLWHGSRHAHHHLRISKSGLAHHHRLAAVRVQRARARDEITPAVLCAPPAPPAPPEAWSPDPVGWPGQWVRALGLPTPQRWVMR